MMPARFPIILTGLFLSACLQASDIPVNVTFSNYSDSYVYPYRIRINGETSVLGELMRCSAGPGTGSLIMTSVRTPPRFIEVQWEHLLSRKVYKARIELSNKAGKWWRKTPFRNKDGEPFPLPPDLVIQWRGARKVAAMLVASSNDFTLGQVDLGIAEGEETQRPGWGPKHYLTYDDLKREPGERYLVGQVKTYKRRYDGTLTNAQRFGCPRLPNGRLDTARLPPQKLPFLTGPAGEHIPCDEYFCRDKAELIRKLRKLGWRQYPPGKPTPAIEFRNAPNPKPAR